MKILSASQIREADAFTIKHEPIKSIDLMERAAIKCADWITQRFDTSFSFKIICGLGNNGGDGLAIARLLKEKKYNVDVIILRYSDKVSPDFIENEKRLSGIQVSSIKSKEEFVFPPI